MSLVRAAADLSSPSYENHSNLYHSNASTEHSTMSTQRFSYMADSYYDPNYIFDSPSEELVDPVISISATDTSDSSLSAQNLFNLEYLEIRRRHPDDFNEETVRLKLQELERELLEDVDEKDDEIECEWTTPSEDYTQTQIQESSSSDSNLTSISTNKETRTPKDMLFNCASAIAEGSMDEASDLISDLRRMVSIQGDPPQRVAAYMVEGLAARLVSSGSFLYKALKCKEPFSSDRLAAMQILFEVCPCFKFGFMAANAAMIESFKDEKTIHIIDFDINQGNQYISLIQTAAATRNTKTLPRIRLTGVDDPDSVHRSIGGLTIVGRRLEELSRSLNVAFEFRAVASEAAAVTPDMLDLRRGGAILINFAFQLHHLPDESVSTANVRDRLLRMVKSLKPKLVTVVEPDVNTNTAPFLPRFAEAYGYYNAVFESLDMTLPRDSEDRMNVERHCLAREIINVLACEGADRIERFEVAGKWRARMTMAGFKPCPVSESASRMIGEANLRQYCERYKVKVEKGEMHLGWEHKTLVVASAWK